MEKNRDTTLVLNGGFIIGIILSILLFLPSVRSTFSSQAMNVGVYILLLVFICHYFVPSNFESRNWPFWVSLGVQFLLAILLSLQGLAGMILVFVYNYMNMLSQKWNNRKLLLISTQTIQDNYHSRENSEVNILDFIQIPVLIALFYMAYILANVSYNKSFTIFPLFYDKLP